MKKMIWLLFLPVAVFAQVNNPSVRYVAVAPSGPCAQAPPVQVANGTGVLYTCNNGTWASQAGEATGPGGSTGQLQWNDLGDFGGTSGGTTNGTHFAFGAGSTIDNFPDQFTDGLENSNFAIFSDYETSTTDIGTNGTFTGVTWNPSSTVPDSQNLFGTGSSISINMDGQSTADVSSTATASAAINNSNTTAINRILGSDNIGVTNGNGNTTFIVGGAFYAGQLGTGEAGTVVGFDLLADTEGGTTDEMDGGIAGLLNGGGIVTVANTLKLNSPIAVNSIGTLNGLDIQQQCGAGITTCKAINAEADEPSFIGGPTTFGDILGYGVLTLAEGTANIATAGGEGWTFACSDCDTPAYQGATCTNTGDNAGAVGLAIDGALVCFGKGAGGYPTFRGSGTYTTATSDSFTVTGATASSFCTFSPTNSTAAAAVLGYVSSVTTNSVTITHAATVASGGTVNIICTKN